MNPNQIDAITGLPMADTPPATMPTPDRDAIVRRLADWADYNAIDPTSGNGLGGPAGTPPPPTVPSWFGDQWNSFWNAAYQNALNLARVTL